MIETLLTRPYWIIDILPAQVPKDSAGQYFAVEKYFLSEPRYTDLRQRYAELLLKLNCYYDLEVGFPGEKGSLRNPPPEKLHAWLVQEHRDLCVLLPAEEALLTLDHGDTYMTVYNPGEKLLALLGQLAQASGLFLWQPPR